MSSAQQALHVADGFGLNFRGRIPKHGGQVDDLAFLRRIYVEQHPGFDGEGFCNRLKERLAVALIGRLKLGNGRDCGFDAVGQRLLRQAAKLPPFLYEVADAGLLGLWSASRSHAVILPQRKKRKNTG